MTNPINILNASPDGMRTGCTNFREHIIKKNFFVDKTYFLQEFANRGSKFTLITRPRRFGKTLLMSMINYFFNIHNAAENRRLFANLLVSKDAEAMDQQGTYAVIFISLKAIKAETYAACIQQITSLVSDLYLKNKYLLDSDKLDIYDKKKIRDFIDKTTYTNSLEKIT